MKIDTEIVRAALRRILEVERVHMFGGSTGSVSARRRELESEVERIIAESLKDGAGKDATKEMERKP